MSNLTTLDIQTRVTKKFVHADKNYLVPNNVLVKDEEVSWDSETTRLLAGMSFLFLFVLFTY